MISRAEDALAVHKRYLSPLGIWPLDKEDNYRKIRFIISSWLQISITAQAMIEMVTFSGDVSEKMDIYLIWVCGILATARHNQVYIYREKLGESIASLINDWSTTMDVEFVKIMQSHAYISQLVSKALVSMAMFSLVFLLTRMIITNAISDSQFEEVEIQFILPTWFLTGKRARTWYWPWTAYQICQCLAACLAGPASDGLIFAIVSHLSGQFQILNLKWRRLGESSAEKGSNCNKKEQLNELIQKHMHLVKLGENLHDSFANLFLVQMTVNIVCIGVSGLSFLISLKKKDYMTVGLNLLAINVMTSQSLVYCYLGDYLRSESETVMEAVYCSFWYNLMGTGKHDLIFVMMKAYRPVCLTAGKFFNMTRQTFIVMVKTAASYLSVLRIMIENDE